jgi:predicted enzyme related to lactoylglutathione lyase
MSTADVRGRFIWHELLTTDTAGAAAFYPRVVPWRTQPSSMPGYTLWMAGQTQIGGLTALPQDVGGPPPHWLIYVGTPSVDASCLQAQGLGAKVLKSPADIPNVGRFAVLSDPQGATFALFTPGAGPPPGPEPPQGGFSWHELATTDVQAAARFYGELFGWRKGRAHDMGAMGVYQMFEHAGNQAGGMCNVQGPSTPPSWLSYVHVADSNRAVAAAKAAGGRLMHGPIEVPGGSWIALMMDPQGGAFAVQEAPRTASQPRPAAAASATPKLATAPKPAAPPPAAAPMKAAPAAPMKAAPAAPMKAAPAAPKPAAVRKPAKKKAAKKKAVKKVKKKVARKPAKRKTGGRKVARKSARRITRRAAPKKRARGRRR